MAGDAPQLYIVLGINNYLYIGKRKGILSSKGLENCFRCGIPPGMKENPKGFVRDNYAMLLDQYQKGEKVKARVKVKGIWIKLQHINL